MIQLPGLCLWWFPFCFYHLFSFPFFLSSSAVIAADGRKEFERSGGTIRVRMATWKGKENCLHLCVRHLWWKVCCVCMCPCVGVFFPPEESEQTKTSFPHLPLYVLCGTGVVASSSCLGLNAEGWASRCLDMFHAMLHDSTIGYDIATPYCLSPSYRLGRQGSSRRSS